MLVVTHMDDQLLRKDNTLHARRLTHRLSIHIVLITSHRGSKAWHAVGQQIALKQA
ncbi:hypothetical protein D3C80_2201400 [compost metagenome]